MNAKELDAIKQRWYMTTPGEWVTGAPDADSVYASRVLALTHEYTDPDCKLITVFDCDACNGPADLVFVAAAHQDIPALLDELASLRAQVEALTADAVIRANRQAILIEAMKRIELNATDSHVMRIAAGALNAIGETKP
jgi:hypothetical protein